MGKVNPVQWIRRRYKKRQHKPEKQQVGKKKESYKEK
jgi:hypothetical protein